MIPGLYPPGPWDDEPDRAEWLDEPTGYTLAIFRHPELGTLNGYVRLPEDHPLIGVDYRHVVPAEFTQEVEGLKHQPIGKRGLLDVFIAALSEEFQVGMLFNVHGSVTFSGRHEHLSPGWWYGFDCGHAFDASPGMFHIHQLMREKYGEDFMDFHKDDVYRDWAYVRAECASLAGQLASLAEVFKLMNAEAREATVVALRQASKVIDADD